MTSRIMMGVRSIPLIRLERNNVVDHVISSSECVCLCDMPLLCSA
jgi:hypothetical protein